MKILFLTPWYPDERNPNHGIFIRDQAVALASEHEVWVVSAKIDYSASGFSTLRRVDSRFQKVRESRITVNQSLPIFNQFNFFLRVAVETFRIGRVFRPEIVHGNIGYPGAFLAWMMSRLWRVPYVVTEHTRLKNNFRSSVHKALTLFGLRNADAVIAVSHWHARELGDFLKKEPEVIPNVIRFEEIPQPPAQRHRTEINIGFLGGLDTSVKGLDILLEAASKIAADYKIHIGGSGVLLEKYKQMAEGLNMADKCIFYGRIPHDGVRDFMGKLDLFVSASRWETFGIAMVEALASGVPVLATDSGGPRDFITEENGLIVRADDSEELREGLRTMIANIAQYNPRIISEDIRARFHTDGFIHRVTGVYSRVTSTV